MKIFTLKDFVNLILSIAAGITLGIVVSSVAGSGIDIKAIGIADIPVVVELAIFRRKAKHNGP